MNMHIRKPHELLDVRFLSRTHFSIANACFMARLGKGRYILYIGIYPVTWNVPNSTNNKPE